MVIVTRSIEILDSECQENLALEGLADLYTPAMNIGDWIKQCRAAAGITQTQLGELLGVTKANVSAWENNRHEPGYSQMLRIATAARHRIPLPGIHVGGWPFSAPYERWDALAESEKRKLDRLVSAFLDEAEPSEKRTATGSG